VVFAATGHFSVQLDPYSLPPSTTRLTLTMADAGAMAMAMTRQGSPISESGACTFETEKTRLQRVRRLLLLASSREDVLLARSSAWKFFALRSKFDGQRYCAGVEPFETRRPTAVNTDGGDGEVIASTRSFGIPPTSVYLEATMTRRRHRKKIGSGSIFSPWNLTLRQVVCAERPKNLHSERFAVDKKRQRTRRRDRGDRSEPEVEDRLRSTSVAFADPDLRDFGVQSLIARSNHQRTRSTSFRHFTNIHRYIDQYRAEHQVAMNDGDGPDIRQAIFPNERPDRDDQNSIERFSVELPSHPRKKHRRDSRSTFADGSPRLATADTSSRQPFSSLSFCDTVSLSSLTEEATQLPKIAPKRAVTMRAAGAIRTFAVGVNINLADFDKISPLSIRSLDSERREPPLDVAYRYRLPEVNHLGCVGAAVADAAVKTTRRRRIDVEACRTDRRSRLSVEHGQRRSSSGDSASVTAIADRRNTIHSMTGVNADLFSARELAAMLFLELPSDLLVEMTNWLFAKLFFK